MNGRAGQAPLLPEVGVLGLPYHHWGTHWMTPHHVLPRLARYFNVVWLEPAHHWRETVQRALRTEPLRGTDGLPESFEIYRPEPWLPHFIRPAWLSDALLRERVRRGFAKLRARGCRKLVLHLWYPTFEAALHRREHDLSLYHIDDEYSFTKDAVNASPQEARVLEASDRAIVISPGLLERKSGINPHMSMVPEGVDSALYERVAPEPADLAPIPRPRIGYTGVLKRQLDWQLLHELARRHPQWSFVYVGPRSLPPELNTIADAMAALPNVHMLGGKTALELASYPQHFDVCTMPYVVDGYTNNIYPLKLHEYLAGGRPIAASRIRSLLDFGHLIHLATGADEWSAALSEALAGAAGPGAGAATAARRAVARQHDWNELIFKIADIIAKGLGPQFSARLERIDTRFAA
ncbi:MAG TPA: glycosyltransferase [Steroidobacteraceae bacterium]|nr:glycosyltransferase [Steroidobacteraceae bacterium]